MLSAALPCLLRQYESVCEQIRDAAGYKITGSITAPAITNTKQHVTCRVGSRTTPGGSRVFGRSAAVLRGSQEGGPRQCGEIRQALPTPHDGGKFPPPGLTGARRTWPMGRAPCQSWGPCCILDGVPSELGYALHPWGKHQRETEASRSTILSVFGRRLVFRAGDPTSVPTNVPGFPHLQGLGPLDDLQDIHAAA